MSMNNDSSDKKILIDAIELSKNACSENLNALINCIEDKVVAEFKIILTTEIEIHDMLMAEAKSRNALDYSKISDDEIKEAYAKYC